MEAETVDRPLSATEIDRLNRDLARQLHDRVPLDARAAPPPQAPELQAPSAGDWSWLPPDSAAHQYADPTLKTIVMLLEPLQETLLNIGDAISKLRRENQELRIALAEMRAEHAETKAKLGEASHKLDRLTVTRKGDPGERGPVGADGREGRPGAQGPKGNRGQKGFAVAAWEIDAEGYRVAPVFEDDSSGPAINLRSLFEQFNHDTEGDEVEAASEQMALQRADLELRAERVRQGRPER